MVEIVVRAQDVAPGAIVTGYRISKDVPKLIEAVEPVKLARIYRGFGQIRAESAPSPKGRRGYGTAIGYAYLTNVEHNRGFTLWLRVRD